MILSAFDSNPALPEIDVPDRILQLVLNLGSEDADTLLMGPIVNDELSEVGMAGLHAPLRSRSKASSEVASLRAKVSLLAMQKHYWWQRYTESVEECRAAQSEVLELRKALAESGNRPVAEREGGIPRPYVDRRLLS